MNHSKKCSYCAEKKSYFVISKDEKSVICKECIDKYYEIIHDETPLSNIPTFEMFDFTPKELKEKLDEYIIGQDKVKRDLCVAVYNHYRRITTNLDSNIDIEIDKSNVLLIGPTGSGKTLIASTLAKILNLPFAIADATTLTESGYVGDDVENILLKLIQNAQYDINRAERGIIFIDEIDKIGRKTESTSITRDVSGEGVQQALLKIIEGTDATVPPQGGRKHPQSANLKINTKNILFVCGGAFIGLDNIVDSRLNTSNLGFNSSVKKIQNKKDLTLNSLGTDDLIKYGLIPELIGRLPIISVLNELTDEELRSILIKPKNSIIKQYTYLFKLEGVKLTFKDEAISEIIKLSKAMKTGARGLRSIVEKLVTDIMFDIPKSSIKSVTIGKKEVIKISKQINHLEENIA